MREFHNSPNAMARCLVQYIDSNERICREIAAHYDNSPCVQTIAKFRQSHKAKIGRAQRDYDRTVVWMDERYQNSMDEANRRFVAALYSARRAA